MKTEHLYNWTWTGYNPVCSGWENCAPGYTVGPLVREFYTIHFILSGHGTFIYKGEEYHPKAGDIFVSEPYVPTYYKADDNDPWDYVWVNFIINGNVPYYFSEPLVSAPELRLIFRGIQQYPDHSNSGRNYVSSCLWNIGDQLSRQTSESAKLVHQAILFIQRYYCNSDFSIEQLVREMDVSHRALIASFMAEKGMTPIEYIVRFRLKKAIEYMIVQDLPPSIAAKSVGYKGYPHFSKIFAQYYDMSPREYKALHSQRKSST
ncbi:MAG: AraC family transcriptional regulator [Oscillospiraceae bacterium]|nr:AraC family transcriptional regulator [Oscillospiraceae bacterium]